MTCYTMFWKTINNQGHRAVKLLKILLILFFIVIVGGVAAVFAAPRFINWNAQKSRIETFIQQHTGYDVTFEGDMQLRLFPDIMLHLDGLKVVPADAAAGNVPLLATGEVNVHASLARLFMLQVFINRISVENPAIHLHVDAQGQANWGLAAADTPKKGHTPMFYGFIRSLGDVVLSNGTVTYDDDATGTHHTFSDMQLSVGGRNLQHAQVDLRTRWNDVPTIVRGSFDLSQLADIPTTLDIKLAQTSLSLKGDIFNPLSEPMLSATTDFRAPDPMGLVRSLKLVPQNTPGTVPNVYLNGQMTVSAGGFKLAGFDGSIDNVKGSGDFAMTWNDKGIDNLTLSCTLPLLNLDSLLAPQDGNEAPPKQTPGNNAGAAAAAGASPQQISRATQRQNVAEKAAGDMPVDLSFLTLANTSHVDVSMTQFIWQQRKFDNVKLHATGQGNVFTLDSFKAAVRQGAISGNGRITFGKAPAYRLSTTFKAVPVEYLISPDGGGVLQGPLDFSADLQTQGSTVTDLLHGLNGKGDLLMKDGTLKGVQLQDMAVALQNILLNQRQDKDSALKQVKASFVVHDGTISNEDLLIESPKITIKGKGTIGLADNSISFRLAPANSGLNLGKVMIPVRVTGKLTGPHVLPDMASAQGVGAAAGAAVGGPVGAAAGAMIGGTVHGAVEAVGNLLGAGAAKDTSPTTQKPAAPKPDVPFDIEDLQHLQQNVHDFLSAPDRAPKKPQAKPAAK